MINTEMGCQNMRIEFRASKLPIINTARLTLRDIAVDDISQDYLDWLNDKDVTRYLEIRYVEQTPEMVRAFVEERLADIESTKHFGVYDNDGKRLIGTVTAHINKHHKTADVSFVLGHSGARGKGYATEAVHGLTFYLFKFCHIAMAWAGYYDGHEASAKVLAKNGYTVQGRLKGKLVNFKGERVDHILVGLLASDFQADEKRLGLLPPEVLRSEK